jgi:hypothetical protein
MRDTGLARPIWALAGSRRVMMAMNTLRDIGTAITAAPIMTITGIATAIETSTATAMTKTADMITTTMIAAMTATTTIVTSNNFAARAFPWYERAGQLLSSADFSLRLLVLATPYPYFAVLNTNDKTIAHHIDARRPKLECTERVLKAISGLLMLRLKSLRKTQKLCHSERSEESLFDLSMKMNQERFLASLGMTEQVFFSGG